MTLSTAAPHLHLPLGDQIFYSTWAEEAFAENMAEGEFYARMGSAAAAGETENSLMTGLTMEAVGDFMDGYWSVDMAENITTDGSTINGQAVMR